MADALAVLGLTVDSTGALAALDRFDAASQKVAASATNTERIVKASARGYDAQREAVARSNIAQQEEIAAIQRKERELNKIANEQRRAENAAREFAAAQREAAVAATASANAIKATGVAAVGSEAGMNRLRGSVTALATQFIGTSSAATSLSSTIGSLALGNAATVAILAGVAAIGYAYDQLTEKNRKLKAAQEESLKSLRDLQDQQRQGFGGKLVDEVEVQRQRLEAMRAEVLKTQEALARPVVVTSNNLTGGGTSADFLRSRLLQQEAAYNELQLSIETGEREVKRRIESGQAGQLAALISGGSAQAAERRKAIERVKEMNAELARLSTIGGNEGERVRLIDDIRKLNDALNPSTAKADAEAKRAQARAAKEASDAIKDQLAAVRALADAESARNREREKEFRQTGVDAVAKLTAQLKTMKEINDARAQAVLKAEEEVVRIEALAAMIGKSADEQQRLADKERARQLQLAGYTKDQIDRMLEAERILRNQVDATEAWRDALQSVWSVSQSIAGAFGEVGRNIASGIGAAQQLVEQLKRADEARTKAIAAAGTQNEKAANSALNAASVASAASFVGISVGLFSSYVSSVKAADEAARQAANAFRELGVAAKNSLELYTRQTSGTELDRTLASLRDGFDAIVKQLIEAGGKAPASFGGRTAVNIRPPEQDFLDALAAYDKLVEAAKRAAAFQDQQAVQELAAREALAQGRGAEAEAIRQQIVDERELEAARVAGADAARLQYIQDVQAAEAKRREAQRAETERRAIFDLDNGRIGFSDPRAASAAAFQEQQARRMADAITRGASEAERTAIALYNVAEAADRAARIAENDTRTTESLLARALGATGNARGAEDATFAARQRQEMVDAIRDGMSPANQAFLRFTQLAERSQLQMQRAIEDGTRAIQERANNEIAAIDVLIEVTRSVAASQIKAIDEQIKATELAAREAAQRYDDQITAVREQTRAQLEAIDAQQAAQREALQSAQAQVAALDRVVQQNSRVVDALTQFTNSLQLGDLSTLSPAQKLAAARAQFDALAASASGGNADAAVGLPGAAQALLQASRAFNASNSGFVSDSERIRATVAAVQAQYGATLPNEQQQLANGRAMVEGIQASLEATNRQREAVQSASEASLKLLQDAKDKAAADAQRIVDELRQRREQISADADATIRKLEEQRKAVQDAADAQIAQLVRVETEAHQLRLRQDEYWTTFLGLTREEVEGRRGVVTTPPASTIPQDQLTEQRRTNTQFEALLTAQSEELSVLRNHIVVTAAASKDATALLSQVVARLDALAGETRRASEGATL